jgi:mannose-6-phosphate isomerase-like protein (cupin superfamily)
LDYDDFLDSEMGQRLMKIERVGFHGDLATWTSRLPTVDGKPFVVAHEHGSLSVELYAPRGIDAQTPHRRDEEYVVIRGEGSFVNGPERHRFGPGDLLFVPAGVEHRFEDISDDLAVWVVFYGPDGGEAMGAGE